ncbi:hypothetical protein [Candidatus Cetobacterium colombiensis]|uniref:Uncharacterized protein n=1 Tax=Candidatus Cetobacterium colombiensis TaxID=3073100 RepID=A0ABU4W6P0_9FUSO|nr:hypothetical protein [Candidatus Cetobacterium colombiensis]MDX8335205.1 hypothetical protein [Candidatus Cetobacterium colombiensis]
MKKILLGLLALSTTLMAQSLENTGDTGKASIQIDTKATVINSGLIITGQENGTGAISQLDLDHGVILATAEATSTVNKDVFVKRANEGTFPEGTVLEVKLNAAAGNNLKNGDNAIAHTLTAAVDSNSTTGGSIALTGATTTATNEFAVLENKNNVKINLESKIAAGALAGALDQELVDGDYTNVSTLTVKISKIQL